MVSFHELILWDLSAVSTIRAPRVVVVEPRDGVGQDTPPNVDRPGDSGITGNGTKGESIDLKVTAAKGKTLYFMCLIHPWMQAVVKVG